MSQEDERVVRSKDGKKAWIKRGDNEWEEIDISGLVEREEREEKERLKVHYRDTFYVVLIVAALFLAFGVIVEICGGKEAHGGFNKVVPLFLGFFGLIAGLVVNLIVYIIRYFVDRKKYKHLYE